MIFIKADKNFISFIDNIFKYLPLPLIKVARQKSAVRVRDDTGVDDIN